MAMHCSLTGERFGLTNGSSRSRATSTTRRNWRRSGSPHRPGGSMTGAPPRVSRCFPEPANLMAWYRLYRGVDRRDVAKAHALALHRKGPPATYLISAGTPFLREDSEQLLVDAPSVIENRCPALIGRMAAMGWRVPASIDRIYDCRLAASELGYSPRHGVGSCLAGDWDPLPSR